MDHTQDTQPPSPQERASTLLALILLITTALIHLILPIWAVQWAQRPFPGFFIEPNLVITETRGTNWPGEDVPPAFTRLLAVDGTPIHTPDELGTQLDGRAIGDTINLAVEYYPGPIQRDVPIPLIAFPKQDLVTLFWAPYVIAVAFLVVGGWVFWLRRWQPAGRTFAMFCTLTALSVSLLFEMWTTQRLARLWTMALPLAAGAMISMGLVFPQETRLTHRRPLLRWLPVVPGLIIGLLNQIATYNHRDPWAYIPAWRVGYQYAVIALLFFLAMVIYRRGWSESPLAREQSRIVLWGGFLAFTPLCFWMIRASLAIITPFSVLYTIPLILFPGSVAYAILRYRLLDIDRIVRQGIVYALLSGLVILATILLVNLAGFALGSIIRLDDPVVIAVLATALVILFNPLRRRLQTIVDGLFHRQEQDYQRRLQRFSHILTTALELEHIVNALYAVLKRTLHPQSLVIYLYNRRSTAYLPLQSEYATAHPILPDSPLISHLQQERGVLFLGDRSRLPALLAPSRDMLATMNAYLIAPIHGSRDLIGLLVLGQEQTGRPYSRESIAFLEALTDQASLALERAQVLQETAVRAQQLAELNQASQSLTSTLKLEPLLQIITEKATEVLQTEAGSLLLRDEETDELVFKVCLGPNAPDLKGLRIPPGAGLAGATVATRQAIIANDAQQDGRWFQGIDQQTQYQTRSILAVPLISKTKVIGVFELLNKRDQLPFNQEDQELAAAFAAQAALAIENAQLYTQTDQSLAQRVHELTMMQELDRVLNATLDIDRVIKMTLDWVMRTSGATAGAIGLVDWEAGGVRVLAGHKYETSPSLAKEDDLWPLDAGIIGRVIHTGIPCLVSEVSADPDYVPVNPATQSQITVPIVREDQVIGIISLESETAAGFGDEELAMAARLADHAAVAIDNARLYAQVKRANQAKSEFISLVSHELKTPMTSIQGYADLLLAQAGGELEPLQIGFLDTIKDNVKRMRGLVNDLADVSRIETGQLFIDKRLIPFRPVVEESLRTMRNLCEEKGLELILESPADLPYVEGDHRRLVQTLTNLVSNACKYTPSPGRITVSITQEAVELNGQGKTDCIVCAVQDTGIGISAEEQENLFSKFFRSDHRYVQETTGTGLGLVITKSLIEMHGGKIWLESELGKGSTFTVAIPHLKSGDG